MRCGTCGALILDGGFACDVRNRRVLCDGICEELKITDARLEEYGGKAMTEPQIIRKFLDKQHGKASLYAWKGEYVTIRQIAAASRISEQVLYHRLSQGMSVEAAILDAQNCRVEYKGEWLTKAEVARREGINYPALRRRLGLGLNLDAAIRLCHENHPAGRPAARLYSYRGREWTADALSHELGMSRRCFEKRIARGFSVEEIISSFHKNHVQYEGRWVTYSELARVLGVPYWKLRRRLRDGWVPAAAMVA